MNATGQAIPSIPTTIDEEVRKILVPMKTKIEILTGERAETTQKKYVSQKEKDALAAAGNDTAYTKEELDGGILDSRYYTKEEIDTGFTDTNEFKELDDVEVALDGYPGALIRIDDGGSLIIPCRHVSEDADGNVVIGSKSGGSYVLISSGGDVSLVGSASVFKEHSVPVLFAASSGGTAPTLEKFRDDGAGSSGVYTSHFADGQEAWLHVAMPSDWKEESTVYPLLRWAATTDEAADANVGLGIEYSWANTDGTFPASTLLSLDVKTAAHTQYKHISSKFADSGITATGKTSGSVLLVRLFRQAAAAPNYAGKIAAFSFGIIYESNRLGSASA